MLQGCYRAIFSTEPPLQLGQPCLVTRFVKKIFGGAHFLERLFLEFERSLPILQTGASGGERAHKPWIVRLLAQKALHFLAASAVARFRAGRVSIQLLKIAE